MILIIYSNDLLYIRVVTSERFFLTVAVDKDNYENPWTPVESSEDILTFIIII